MRTAVFTTMSFGREIVQVNICELIFEALTFSLFENYETILAIS